MRRTRRRLGPPRSGPWPPRSSGDAERRGAAHEAAEAAEEDSRRRDEAAERARRAHQRDERIRARLERRARHERRGLARFRPGPGSIGSSPGMWVSQPGGEAELDREIEIIARALDEHGEMSRTELARLVGARFWGPGVFRAAVREAVDEGSARPLSRTVLAPPPQGGRDHQA